MAAGVHEVGQAVSLPRFNRRLRMQKCWLVVSMTVLLASCTQEDQEHAKQKARQAGQELKHETEAASQKVRQGAEELKEKAGPKLHQAGEELKEDAHQASEKLKQEA